jgi:hypothetical protein
METFTSIGFGIQEINQPLKLAKSVPVIFDFMKELSTNELNPSTELIKSMLNFAADMINLYGHEIKGLVKQDFLFNNISKLKQIKGKKTESNIKWIEEVSYYLFYLI